MALVALATAMALAPATAAAGTIRAGRTVVLHRGAHAHSVTVTTSAPGHRVLEYSLVWSNEDGGTDTPALMARWGRSTDIEWIYRVEVDQAGNRVPGTAVYQAATT